MTDPIRVLLVDHDSEFADIAANALEGADERFVVESMASTTGGIDRLAHREFHCVVSEYELPGRTGIEFLERLRAEHPNLPFVLCTDTAFEDLPGGAVSGALTDFFGKRSDTAEYQLLAHRIAALVNHARTRGRNEQLETLAEEQEDAETRYRSLFENTPVVIWEWDASDAKTYVDSLAEDTDDLEAFFDDNPEELEEILDRMAVIGVNETALDYYRAESKQHLLGNFDELATEDSFETNKRLWARIAEGATRFRSEITARTLEGERRHEIFEVRVPDAYTDDYSRVYSTATDVTERKRKERQLERQNDRLEEFASIVSHDLRNPLNVADGWLEMVREECDSEHLERIDDALGRCQELIDDLLALAREDDDVIADEPVDLAGIATACWRSVDSPDATLTVDADRSVRADRRRLRQLLENLMRNAVDHGGEDVTIGVGELDSGFYVEDDGPGIPDEERDDVFESGYSTADSGTGLGLSIVAEIAEAHDWELRATDGTVGGARFELTGVELEES